MKKSHQLAKGTDKFKISERMRSLICLVGQSAVYGEGSELINTMMGLEVCAPQIQRLCIHYGSTIDPLVKANVESVIPILEGVKEQEQVYVMVDGSMIYTREDQWREL